MSRRYSAIICDLFGTLVDNIITEQDYQCFTETARVLDVELSSFIYYWSSDDFRAQRHTGVYETTAVEIAQVCRHLEVSVTPAQVSNAVQTLHSEYGLSALAPRDGVVETLVTLKQQGYALGLISDCSRAIPEVWEQSAFTGIFHATVFSCVVRAKKPEPLLYQLACARLGLPPALCLYIGDGGSRELTGARRAGMDAVLICAPHEREVVMQRADPRQWDGPVIERIDEILVYLNL